MKTKQTGEGTNFELVGDFMEAFGQSVQVDPTWTDFNTRASYRTYTRGTGRIIRRGSRS